MKRKSKKRNQWSDHYTQKAKKEKYPARSIYKLKEIQRKFQLIQPGNKVLDLGCSPGSWLLYASEITGKSGQVTGVDIKPVTIHIPSHVKVVVADIMSLEEESLSSIGNGYHVVISDMAPATTGQKDMDAARSYHLCEAALKVAEQVLKPGGKFVCKIFQGYEFEQFLNSVRSVFHKHKIFKPQSSRKASKEIFVIGMGKI